jgi:AraC-like DNA-binding protein
MYLIPPYTRVNLRTEDRIEKFYFHFSIRYAGIEILEGINRCFALPLAPELLRDILAAFRGGDLADLLQFQSLAHSTLSIEQHLSAGLTGRQICGALGSSYETLRRNFSRDNGITFNRYINGRLIQEAAMQLLLTDRTVQEIAAALGFSDEFYFSRLFKQKMEYSPREYRRINAVLRNG